MNTNMLSGGGAGSSGTYASKKRKKPVQKIPKPAPPEGAKSNPSKRHRDRLNMELDKLTNLLPFSEEVRTRLDKLSVLRLSVGYLKVKGFFNATMKKSVGGVSGWPAVTVGGNGQTVSSLDRVNFSEGELLLRALNGFVLVVTAEGYVFYASPTIQDYLGFHQSDVVHQSVFELIHTDDRPMFRRQLHFALDSTQGESSDDPDGLQKMSELPINIINYNPQQLPPENSSFLERSFCCRLRCLLDNSSGFLALNFQGRLKYLHGQNKMAEDGTMVDPQLALFAIATPLQPPSILEIRSKTLIFQTKHKLDFTPLGIDTRGKVLLGYTEAELCMRGSGYQFIHPADMMHCADNHMRMIKTGESGFTVFRLLAKSGAWIWVQSNARFVYKGGRPDFIVVRQRALTNEEGEEHLHQRNMKLPFSFATGEAILYETVPSPNVPEIPRQAKEGKISKPTSLPPNSLLTCMLKQDQPTYQNNNDPNSQFCLDKAFSDSHALLNVPGKTWEGAESTLGIKEETAMRDMMDSLQQIIGDSTLCEKLDDLDIDQQELKEWENTLLRMNNMSNAEIPVEISDIMANDIFSYVEDMLFNETSPSLNEQLPECLSELQLQEELKDIMDIQEGEEMGSVVRGMMKLVHVEVDIPLGQQTSPEEQFVGSMELCQNVMGFDPSLSGQHNQATLHTAHCTQQNTQSQQNQAELTQKAQANIQTGNLFYPENVMIPNLQNQAQQIGFQSQGSLQLNPAIRQNNQWMGVPNSNNISVSQKVQVNPAPSNCLQGQFPVYKQKADSQRFATWQSFQPSIQQGRSMSSGVPNIHKVPNIPNGHHHVPGAQPNNLLQDPFPRLILQSNYGSDSHSQPAAKAMYSKQRELNTSTSVYGRQGERMQTSNEVYGQNGELLQPSNAIYGQQAELLHPPNAVYDQQGKLMSNPTSTPISSCMFERGTQAPISDFFYGSAEQEAPMSACQTTNMFQGKNATQGSCLYQSGPAEGIINNTVMQLDGTNTCHLPQQFVTCNNQTQITNHPLKENGPFHFSPLTGGTLCFTNTNQNTNF